MITITHISIFLNLCFALGNAQFYYQLNSATHGPFSSAQLEAWWRGGYFPNDMPVSEDPGMSTAVPVAQLFSSLADGEEFNSMADYSEDEDVDGAFGGGKFSIDGARGAAQKLASMDVKEYKAKASELATDMRYAAQDSLVKAKEISSMLGIKVADKLSALKQKVKESTGQANPGFRSQHHQYHNNRNSMQQQGAYQGQGGPYDGYQYTEAPDVNQGGRLPPSPQQSDAAAAVYDAVETAYHDSSAPTSEHGAVAGEAPPSYSLPLSETLTGTSTSSSSGGDEAGLGLIEGTNERGDDISASALTLGLDLAPPEGWERDVDSDYGDEGPAYAPAPVTAAEAVHDVGEGDDDDMNLRAYENVYVPWQGEHSPGGGHDGRDGGAISAEQQDQHYARRVGRQEQEQQWYNPYPEQEGGGGEGAGLHLPADGGGDGVYGYTDTVVDEEGQGQQRGWHTDTDIGTGVDFLRSSSYDYYDANSDEEDGYSYPGILAEESRGVGSRLRTAVRRAARKAKRMLGLRSRRGRTSNISGSGGVSMNIDSLLGPASASPGLLSTPTPAGSGSLLEGLVRGTNANVQVAMTALHSAPALSFILTGTVTALPILLLISLIGIPAAVRQLVIFSGGNGGDSGDKSTPAGNIIDDFSPDGGKDTTGTTNGGGLVQVVVKILESTPIIRDWPGSQAFIQSIARALQATPTCLFVLLLTQRIAVMALTVVPALLSNMERMVGREMQRKRDVSRVYPDPLDSALWATVGKLRFRRLTEMMSMMYVPVVLSLSLLLLHQAMMRVHIYTGAGAEETGGAGLPLALPEFTGPLQVTLLCTLLEGMFVLWASLKQHAAYGGNSNTGGVNLSQDQDPSILASRDTTGAFPSLLFVLMLNTFVRTGLAHQAQGGRPWGVLPAARKLLSAEIRRTRRLLEQAHEQQHGGMQGQGGLGTSTSTGTGRDARVDSYKAYSHSPLAVSRRGIYSLAVFTSTLLATASCLRLLALHDHLHFTVVALPSSSSSSEGEGDSRRGALQLPLDGLLWLLRHFGKTLFVGLNVSVVSPVVRSLGFNYNADRGLYLGVNILLAVLSLLPITLWTSYIGAVVRYQNLDDELLSLSTAVKAPIPSSSSPSGGSSTGTTTTSFRTVVSSSSSSSRGGGDGEVLQGVRVEGRVNLRDARAVLEAVALEEEYRDH